MSHLLSSLIYTASYLRFSRNEIVNIDSFQLDMKIYSIEDRLRDLRQIVSNRMMRTPTSSPLRTKPSTWARIHRGDELESRREYRGRARTRELHPPGF
jgi:hypothetical protein